MVADSVVLVLADVPMLAIFRVSTSEPVPMLIVSPAHTGHGPDIDSGISRTRSRRQTGVGETEQVESVRCELRAGRNLDRGENGLFGCVFRQAPVVGSLLGGPAL